MDRPSMQNHCGLYAMRNQEFCKDEVKIVGKKYAFVWRNHPVYPFLRLLNRDEFHSRALAWWEGGEIVGGRDGLAVGTWPACTRDGKVAFITNAREVQMLAQAKS